MTALVILYINFYNPTYDDGANSFGAVFDSFSGYGLGGSSMALFGRVGGGIYTKAADVGADIVGKVEQGWDEDHPKNPATIADNVGDNVGDIAGMGSDLFGSLAEATCAALVVSAAYSTDPNNSVAKVFMFDNMYADLDNLTPVYVPLLISGFGIIVCILTSFFGVFIYKVDEPTKIELALKIQLFLSTILMLIALFVLMFLALPEYLGSNDLYPRIYVPICAGGGLVAGFIIGMTTDYYTSNAHAPVQSVARACETGAATNIIHGLALGYYSCIPPIILLAIVAYIGNVLLGMYGVALGALGMLSTLCVGLAIDAYGPISDNAGGISEMCSLPEEVREKTDALDAAGNTTAAIGKGFAIGSAALVSLSLYGAFLTRASVKPDGDGHYSIVRTKLIIIFNISFLWTD
jgi:inorganic pyrophosphatase